MKETASMDSCAQVGVGPNVGSRVGDRVTVGAGLGVDGELLAPAAEGGRVQQ